MSQRIQAVRGMNDILPEQARQIQAIESAAGDVFTQYGYQKIILPVVEKTALFARSVGEATDIVEKEMYTFEDRNGDSLSLRPEGTAGCVRAGLEHGLLYHKIQRLWYSGPMFRHERPQKGRYRQFYQMGVEVYGLTSASVDAELLLMQQQLWARLGVADHITLEINTLGSYASRERYRQALVQYCQSRFDELDADSQRRLATNPLRILDSKNPAMRAVISQAPSMLDYLDDDARAHYAALKCYLGDLGVKYVENPQLVRGLDYYCHTVFEWVTDQLGAQGTVSAGGRYDKLVEKLGGHDTPAVGFALGIERLALLMTAAQTCAATIPPLDVYIVVQDDQVLMSVALKKAQQLRQKGMAVIVDHAGGSFKRQFKQADQLGAEVALIIGEQEMTAGQAQFKFLRGDDTPRRRDIATLIQQVLPIMPS